MQYMLVGWAFAIQGIGQNLPEPDLVVMGKVPWLLFAGNRYVQPLDSNHIKLAPGRLTIQPFNLSEQIFSGLLWFPGPSLTELENIHDVSFGIFKGDSLLKSMERLCYHDENDLCLPGYPAYSVLLDEHQEYELIFREESQGRDIYRFRFSMFPPKPELDSWNEPLFYDGEEKEHLSNSGILALSKKGTMPVSKKKGIVAAKPGLIQVNFRKTFPWADTVLEYAIIKDQHQKPYEWKAASSKLVLPVTREKQGLLAVRYHNGANPLLIPLTIAPRWYEPGWVKALLCITLMAVFWGLFASWQHYKVKKASQAQAVLIRQLQAMQAGLAPHMMFNALATLQGLLKSGEVETADRFVSGLGLILRQSYQQQVAIYLSLSETLTRLRQCIQLQQIRFGFGVEYKKDELIDEATIEIPSGLLQPVVENAIKYNLQGKEGYLLMECKASNQDLVLLIQAFDRSPISNPENSPKQSTGFGLSWIKSRIAIHNQMFPAKPVKLETHFSESGSCVTFTFQNQITL